MVVAVLEPLPLYCSRTFRQLVQRYRYSLPPREAPALLGSSPRSFFLKIALKST